MMGATAAHRFSKGDRVRHCVTREVGTVVKDWDGITFVHVQFDDDIDDDGTGWVWTTEPEKLEMIVGGPTRPADQAEGSHAE